MLVHFINGLWAIAAGFLLAVAIPLYFFLRRQSLRWRMVGIVLPLAAAACVALALAGTSVGAASRVAIVLDFSPSARNAPWHDPEWVRQLAARRLDARQALSVLGDDGTQRRLLLAETTPSSTWPAGFGWENAPAADAGAAPQWLMTDALFAPPEKVPAAVTVVRPAALDVGIRDIIARQATNADSAPIVEILVQVRAVGWPGNAAANGLAELKLQRDGTLIGTVMKEFSAPARQALDASSWVTFRDALSADEARGPHRYTAIVALMPRGDAWPENDRGSVVWPGAAGAPRVLTISNRLAISPEAVRPEQFFKDASQLAAEGWQAVILDDVPAAAVGAAEGKMKTAALPEAGAKALDRFVREIGGGLLIASRGSAFGPGHYGEGPRVPEILENLSPVWSRPHDNSGTRIVFLLDASASMNEAAGGERKFSLLARAVQDAGAFLADGDSLALITFNSQGRLLAKGAAREIVPALAATLGAVQPQGATVPDSALEALAGVLKSDDFHSPTVVLVTDGEIPTLDVPRWKQTLGGAPLVIIAPRPAAAQSPLEKLAASGINAQWHPAADPALWRSLLPELVLNQIRGTVRHETIAWRAGSLTGDSPSWIQTWIKPEAQLIAQGPRGQPIAAVAQRGLGRVVAVMIPEDVSTARAALRSEVLQRILAPAGDRRFQAGATRLANSGWLLTADGIDGDQFLDHLELAARILSASESDMIVRLRQTAPGHYESRLPAMRGAAAIITRAEGTSEALVARVQIPDVQNGEFPASVDQLWRPVGGAAGRPVVLPAGPEEAARWEVPQRRVELAPALWLAAAVMAVTALWLRK